MALEIKGLFNPTSISVPTSHLAQIQDGGEEPTDSFTVTKNLSHCAISNEVVGEASYYAEIAPTGGWSDLQVTIKVGGVDMSEYYSSGVINIPNVTGNIVITATAAAAPLVSITATYTQSGTVYDTDSLDSLKADLVVTANYDNGTSEIVTTYTLSGTLTVGTSTITVSYGGKTTTFNVTVSEVSMLYPLYEGTFDVKVGNGTKIGTATITKGTSSSPSHVAINLTANAAGGQTSWINFTSGTSGATTAVNNQATWFTFESGETYTFTVSNTVNASSLQYSVNLRGATTNATIDGSSAGNGDAVCTVTPSADVNVGCMVMWLASATFANKTIEFDATLTDSNGVRYF